MLNGMMLLLLLINRIIADRIKNKLLDTEVNKELEKKLVHISGTIASL